MKTNLEETNRKRKQINREEKKTKREFLVSTIEKS